MQRRAKIVATIGPASQSEQVLEQLLRAGMNVARMNFSHGLHSEHAERIACLRRLSEKFSLPVGILQDLQGPKVRVGVLEPALELVEGEIVRLHAEGQQDLESGEKQIPVAPVELFEAVSNGSSILLDDGHLSLQVVEMQAGGARALCALRAKVLVGGALSSHKGINLPGTHLNIPGFTEKDRADLAFGLSQKVDFVAMSFVRTRQDVEAVREAMAALDASGEHPLLIAKLEQAEALDNLDQILAAADGVMVARGDLGVEMPPETVPIAQKRIIQAANRSGKIVITATQMLDSMMVNPLPTRAEVSDVANAIFDGSDAVMLSGETASGLHPLASVQFMDRIVRAAEADFCDWGHYNVIDEATNDDATSIARAARELAHDLNVVAVAVFTHTGRTSLLMSKARPCVPILAFTSVQHSLGRMCLFWGVVPHLLPVSSTLRKMVNQADAQLMADGWATKYQQVVVVCGFPFTNVRPPNMALLHNVGELL
jgi:pyruvate kinase